MPPFACKLEMNHLRRYAPRTMPRIIDLRSDVKTRPTPEMWRAMTEAPLGDDAHREDPTAERLQELAAGMLGKEAALFTTSGTQGNLLGILALEERGGVIIGPEDIHVSYSELDGYRHVAGMSLVNVPSSRGVPDVLEIRRTLEAISDRGENARLLWMENTHNHGGGIAITGEAMAQMRALADEFGLKIHVDGSRIFNAATCLNVPVSALARDADTLQFCLSKGLAAPVGSVLVGEAATIARARKHRKMLGGQMRQTGVLAAAGIVALERMSTRLQEDHDNARLLAEGLAHIPGIEIDVDLVQTNLVYCTVSSAHGPAREVLDKLEPEGILAYSTLGPRSLRFVLHYEITRDDVEAALKVIKRVMG
jgi:threonine aldolase